MQDSADLINTTKVTQNSAAATGFLIIVPIVVIFSAIALLTNITWLPPLLFILTIVLIVFIKTKKGHAYFSKFLKWLLFKSGSLQYYVWSFAYNKFFPANSYSFINTLNYGYAPLEGSGIYLEKYKDDIFDVYQFQMYDNGLSRVGGIKSLKGKTLVEVGCGRGGSFRYIVNEYQPKEAIGIDFCAEHIQFCRENVPKMVTSKDS